MNLKRAGEGHDRNGCMNKIEMIISMDIEKQKEESFE